MTRRMGGQIRNAVFAVVALAIGVAALLDAGPARAEPTAAELAVARKAFGEASELEGQKKWVEAAAKLREALAIKETPGLRYHLGFCLEHQNKLVEALVEYDRADEMLKSGVKAPDVGELLAPARDGVRKRVAKLTLKGEDGAAGLRIEIDGRSVNVALVGKSMPQNPGKHVITAGADGRQPFRKEIDLVEGELLDVSLELPAQKAAGAPAPGNGKAGDAGGGSRAGSGGDSTAGGDGGARFDSKSSSTRTIVLIGEGVFTAAALGAGIYFTIQKGKDQDEVDAANAELTRLEVRDRDGCLESGLSEAAKKTCEQAVTLTDQRNRSANLALAGFVGAGVGAVATVATFLLWKPAPREKARLVVTPVAGARTYGLGVAGSF